jgi:hypothetical protein
MAAPNGGETGGYYPGVSGFHFLRRDFSRLGYDLTLRL